MSKHLTLNPNNPSPTVRPFLTLHFVGDNDGNEWFVDVDGKIDLYLTNYSNNHAAYLAKARQGMKLPAVVNWLSQATPLLRGMLGELTKRNRIADRIYADSAARDHAH